MIQSNRLLITTLVLTACLAASQVNAGTLTSSLLDSESDIINTGGTLVSAANFGEAAVTINGILHPAGSAGGVNLTLGGTSPLFEGDFRNGQSGLGGNLEILLSGIAGRNNLTLAISGLTVGTEYLFQAYWEGWPTEVLQFTAEGDSLSILDQNATLITYAFTATDNILNISLNKTVVVDGNEWLSGYSLQVVPEPSSLAMLAFAMISLFLFRRQNG